MSEFDIGNVYSRNRQGEKKYFVAIRHKTLVSCNDGSFGTYTTSKSGYTLEANMPVADLCHHWQIDLSTFDEFMAEHFAPDEEAMDRIYREKVSRAK